ncbi:unnamed protein product [Nesidiocoris tenuis]|uniref:Uncharacterized protein n=1 Tax=Nesidiocoris tenuis TaxID=355587 RepID=A0A6H5HL66_9HEMI|nr:unnamed protein product [Nesidiocoris tenuis]
MHALADLLCFARDESGNIVYKAWSNNVQGNPLSSQVLCERIWPRTPGRMKFGVVYSEEAISVLELYEDNLKSGHFDEAVGCSEMLLMSSQDETLRKNLSESLVGLLFKMINETKKTIFAVPKTQRSAVTSGPVKVEPQQNQTVPPTTTKTTASTTLAATAATTTTAAPTTVKTQQTTIATTTTTMMTTTPAKPPKKNDSAALAPQMATTVTTMAPSTTSATTKSRTTPATSVTKPEGYKVSASFIILCVTYANEEVGSFSST